MSTVNEVGLKIMRRAELQKLAKIHGIKANLKTEAIVAQLLARFPDGVPLDVIQVDDHVQMDLAAEDPSQGAQAGPDNSPAVRTSRTKNARVKATKKRLRDRVVPAEGSASVIARLGLAMSVSHPETGCPSQEGPRGAEMSASADAEPAARVSSASRAPYPAIPPTLQPEADADAELSHLFPTVPSVSVHAPPIHDRTMSSDAFASGRPAWVPVYDPNMPPDADAGWTPSPVPRAPSPAESDPEEPCATEEQLRAAVDVIADISKKHKERWGEVNAFEGPVDRLSWTVSSLRTLVRQERAHRTRIQDYITHWKAAGPERKDGESSQPPRAKPAETRPKRRPAVRRDPDGQDVRVSEVLDLTEDRRLNLNGKKRRRDTTPVGEHGKSSQRQLKKARRLETPAKNARGRMVPAPTAPVLGATTGEDGEEW
ncbi:hypothetical protein C2E23DRAFT_882760 [Lenzites betulinus]|nr:hypothetical protein C2E23DRAFT_882760 [Lenzites betulinus]